MEEISKKKWIFTLQKCLNESKEINFFFYKSIKVYLIQYSLHKIIIEKSI